MIVKHEIKRKALTSQKGNLIGSPFSLDKISTDSNLLIALDKVINEILKNQLDKGDDTDERTT